ncbi:MAG: aminomethyl-transferring glycine dehydrogenase subunit GcvPB [Desulfurococcales archaeon]|jgi:glycine dehydrogenase subunit 2|nr:aminomethyl-transferring glycine dehydrogenase subunit GcvPB [Desulfurococcales archaeon]
MWRQARWDEKLILELGGYSHDGPSIPYEDQFKDIEVELPKSIARLEPPSIPSLTEIEVVRHFTRLSQMSYGVDIGPVPLGSCTMKYNPKIMDLIAIDPRIADLHPLQDESMVQGLLEIIYITERWLSEITGMDKCSFQPPAGSAGELAGAIMIKKYHLDRGEEKDEMLIPDSAHGSNSASAAMAGFKVVRIPTDQNGEVSIEALKAALGPRTAGAMLTNPNTLGIFESRILEISDLVHSSGGLLYYDGANLNGILGIARPGDMGFDIAHLNLHKTFATPHGSGGPGGGVVCARGELVDYLPRPLIDRDGDRYYWNYTCEKCIGMVRAFYGNIVPVIRTFIYISMLGPQGLREVSEISVINTNYFIKRLLEKPYYELPYNPERPRKHEAVISASKIARETGITAEDIAKALLDEGLHAPTIYFPLIVGEALMIEFTEAEPKEIIDRYAEILNKIAERGYKDPTSLKSAPRNTAVSRLDAVRANHPRTAAPSYRVYRKIYNS